MANQYKFVGGDRVYVDAEKGLGGVIKDFSGTVIVCTSQVPILGQMFVVLADNPEDVGLNNDTYPFSAVIISENHIKRIADL